jgi:hypothetical protein
MLDGSKRAWGFASAARRTAEGQRQHGRFPAESTLEPVCLYNHGGASHGGPVGYIFAATCSAAIGRSAATGLSGTGRPALRQHACNRNGVGRRQRPVPGSVLRNHEHHAVALARGRHLHLPEGRQLVSCRSSADFARHARRRSATCVSPV